jgi:hypothetical protein
MRRGRDAALAQHGAEDIGQRGRRGNRAAGIARRRELQQQRHLDRLAVEEDAVLLFPMVAEAFAVVGDDEDEGAVVEPAVAQELQEVAHDRIGAGDLRVIRRPHAAAVRLGRVVRRVWLVEVEKDEERLRGMRIDERARRGGGRGAVALHESHRLLAAGRRDAIVVRLEAARDPGRAAQHERRHGGASAVAGAAQ